MKNIELFELFYKLIQLSPRGKKKSKLKYVTYIFQDSKKFFLRLISEFHSQKKRKQRRKINSGVIK